jgi:hypothetical protein
MDNVNYYADGVSRVMTVLKDAFGDYFKAYFESTMDEIPESYVAMRDGYKLKCPSD